VHENGKKLLQLMFRSGETVCVSHNKYGYHSIPLENAMNGPVILIPPDQKRSWEHPKAEQLQLVALNPINGFRKDENCIAFRSFLVEMDYGPLAEQLAYAKKIGLPYSAVIFSGNKSLHFLITLDEDLENETVWRRMAEWILGIATVADQVTKNPSRNIRIPGAERESGKFQKLVEFKGPTKLSDLITWLSKHPDAKPKPPERRIPTGTYDFSKLKPWVIDRLMNGLDPTKGRNQQWFSISMEFALAGYSEDDTFNILQDFFLEERDFKEKEWQTAIKSGFKHADKKE
jgi:hypothetical protein